MGKGVKYTVEFVVPAHLRTVSRTALEEHLCQLREWGDCFITRKESVEDTEEAFEDIFNREVK